MNQFHIQVGVGFGYHVGHIPIQNRKHGVAQLALQNRLHQVAGGSRHAGVTLAERKVDDAQ